MNSFEQLSLLRKKGGMITKFSRNITTASNGLPYYFVEFTSTNGSQYGIQAYGEEATELYSEVMRILGYFEGNASVIPTPVHLNPLIVQDILLAVEFDSHSNTNCGSFLVNYSFHTPNNLNTTSLR